MDLTKAEAKATYTEFKQYAKEYARLNVNNPYIAQVKHEFWIIERANYNLGDG